MRRYSTIFARVKRIMLSPAKEWKTIAGEKQPVKAVLAGFILPFSLLTMGACYIGYGIVGSEQDAFGLVASEKLGIRYAMYYASSIIVSIFISSLAISFVASFFNATTSFTRNFKLVAFSYTPLMAATILLIAPILSPIVLASWVYNLIVLFAGMKRMTDIQPEKKVNYFVTVAALTVFIYLAVSKILFRLIVD